MLINTKRTKKELELLAGYLKGDISLDNGMFSLNLSDEIGEGQIRCVCFNQFMTSMEVDVSLKRNTLVSIGSGDTNVIYFIYGLEGNCSHKFDDQVEFFEIDPLRPIVVIGNKGVVSQMLIRENERLHLNLIRIDRIRYLQEFMGNAEDLDFKLKELLDAFNGKNYRYHLGRHNLKMGRYVKELAHNTRNNDLSSLLKFKGLSNLILADQIDQFFQEIRREGERTNLTQKELHSIHELSDFINNYPEIQHSIKSLCEKGGISSAKLQEGFKLMHNLTVSNYIRNVRLEKAEFMIRTSDFNISEVVYTIGLTSRSYFCKIFKGKYKCSPKEYRKKAHVTMLKS